MLTDQPQNEYDSLAVQLGNGACRLKKTWRYGCFDSISVGRRALARIVGLTASGGGNRAGKASKLRTSMTALL